jgi:hypothetical protein
MALLAQIESTQIGKGADRGSITVSDHRLQQAIRLLQGEMLSLHKERKHPESAGDANSITPRVTPGIEIVRKQTNFPLNGYCDARGFTIIKN